jgi:predicted metalloprotease with PDZ domain
LADLRFKLDVRHPERRRIEVELELDRSCFGSDGPPTAAFTGTLFLPTWTPGSYLVREFSRHLSAVVAVDAETGTPLACRKVTKNRFAITLAAGCARARVRYSVYAHELSVRTADLTSDHAYWNHACVLLWPLGQTKASARLEVMIPAGWSLASPLPREMESATAITLRAADLDEAMDAPCLAGRFHRLDWQIGKVPHSVVLDGLGNVVAPAQLLDDLNRIIACAAEVFGGDLPYRQYLFLCLFAESGHAGLEHRDSTTLLSARTAMRPGKDYQEFLGLAAHEFFHVWNVKRMRPQELWSYDYEVENYTPMLWLAEGFTAYYDDLICRRANVLSVDDYLALLSKNLTTVLGARGRFRLSLADSSFDAWIRLYRPDENTRNSSQNYYGNGAVAALCLDLAIRRASDGKRSLDDAMRELYRTTYGAGRGYRREDVTACLSRTAGTELGDLLTSLIDGPLDPPLTKALAHFGVRLVNKDQDRPYLGLTFENGGTVVASVTDEGPAATAGIAPGDEILALDGVRVTAERWQDVFQTVACPDRPLPVLLASRGLIAHRTVTPTNTPIGTVALELEPTVDAPTLRRRSDWLATTISEKPPVQSRS